MIKNYIILLMSLVMLLGFMPKVQAQTVWDGTADITWYDATQTSFDISTPEQLAGVAQLVNNNTTSFNGMTLNLTADIWLNSTGDSTNNWTPIGGSATPTSESSSDGYTFKGIFNAHGHTIYNLYCDKSSYFHAGLFGAIESPTTIDSLVMVNPILKSQGMMGAITGMVRGAGAYIRHCLVINARIVGTGGNNTGGIVGAGYPASSTIYVQNCGVTGTISANYPGGIFGNGQHSNISNTYFAGTITVTGSASNCGTLTAHEGTFSNCYAYANITSVSSGKAATPVSQAYMQSDSAITALGTAFKMDNGVNNGYPIMSYMAGVEPVAADLCLGESITLTAFGYASYAWSTGATTSSITVQPTTTTTYTLTGTKADGSTQVNSSVITVFPQAVITATVMPASDGQIHGTVTPEISNVPCGSTQTVTLTITPDANWHIARIMQDGVVLREDDPNDGPVVTYTIDPQGTLADVQIYFDNQYNVTVTQQLTDGTPLSLSNLVSPWGSNGVYSATAGNDLTYTFSNSDRYHITDVVIDGVSQGVITSYTFYSLNQTHSIQLTYADSCGIFALPYTENFSNGFSECWSKSSTYSSTYPYISSERLYFYTSSSTYTMAVLPQVMDDLGFTMGELQVSFSSQFSTLSNQLQVGVMTDPEDASTFMPLESVANTATGVMQDHVVFLSSYTGTGKYIAFKWQGTAYGNCYLDNVEVNLAPTCSPINNLEVSDIYGTNATLSWDPNVVGVATGYDIQLVDNGTQVTTTYTTTETTYILMGLDEQTSYTVSVQPDCGAGDLGTPVNISFSTPCVAPIEVVNNSYPTSTYSTEGNHFPMSNHYLNSFTEQIYLPSDFNNTSADFSGMSFQYNISTVITRTLDIYMAHTADSVFVDDVWATPLDNYVHVYHGPVSFNYNGTNRWVDITFDTNFYYNGSDNLLLIVNDITGTSYNNSNSKFYTIDTYVNRSQCEYNNDSGTNWSINNMPTTGRLHTQVDNIRLTACDVVSCITPNTLSVGYIDASSAEIHWVNPNTAQNYELEYKAVSDADWTTEAVSSGNSHLISGLNANTLYQARVRAICGTNNQSEWSQEITFRTECDAITVLPYTNSFDSDTYGSGTDAYVYCWDRYASDPSKPVYMYPTSAAHSTPNALRFYDGPGATTIAIMPKVDESISLNQLEISFWVRKTETSSPAIFELGVMTDKSDPTTFEILDTIPTGDWALVEYSMENYSGYGQYVAFRVTNGNGGNNIRLDDVSLDYIPVCLHPVDLVVDNVTAETVTVHWSEAGTASFWMVEYGPAGFTPGEGTVENATDTTLTITGLNPNTQYDLYVLSDCGGNFYSTTINTSFRTDCGPIVQLPYSEDFETGIYNTGVDNSSNQQDYILCWNRYASDHSHNVYISGSSSYAHSSSHFLDFHWTSGCYNMAITPRLDDSFDVSTLMVNFWACRSGSSGTLEVGVMTDPLNDSTFVSIDTIDLSAMNTYAYAEQFVKFDSYTGTGKYIAFRVSNASSCGFYVDDVVIDYAPDCSPVNNLEVSEVTGTSAVVTWAPGVFGTVDSYTLEYSEAGLDSWTTVDNITATTSILSGLNFSTYYDVRVRANCDNFSSSDWVMVTFRTNCLVGGDVTIGEGTSTNNYLPSYCFYDYSYSQQLFLASEIGAPRTIESVTFDMANYSVNRTYNIYLMHTTATSVSDWIDASTAQLVFNASQQLQAGQNTFQFSTPFEYNGSDNLLLIVLDMTGSYSSGNTWRTHTAPFTASRYKYQDNTPFSTSSVPTSGTSTSSRNNVIFGSPCDTTTTCVAPYITISAITSDGATVNWVPGYTESAWELEYRPLSDTNWIVVGAVSSMSEMISGLTANTTYKVRMRSSCGAGEYSYWAETSFTTACGALTITATEPWTEDFDGYQGSGQQPLVCWSTPVTSSYNAPFVYCGHAPACHSGSNSVELKGNSGEMNVLVLPEFTNDIHELRLSFWATATSTSNGILEVGVMTDATDTSTFELLGLAGTPGSRNSGSASGNGNLMGPFDFNTVQAGAGRIALRFSSTSSSLSWNLDDFIVEIIPSCSAPAHNSVVVNNITDNSAEVSFTDNDPTHASWIIYYRETASTDTWNSMNVSTTTGNMLSGLQSNTSYSVYVVTDCGGMLGDDQTNTVTFTTTTVPTSLPYSTDFEDITDNLQWGMINGTQTNQWYVGMPTDSTSDVNTTVGGSNGLYVSNNGGVSNTYSSSETRVYAYRDILVPNGTTELLLSFDWKAQGGSAHNEFLRIYWLDPSIVTLTPGNNPPTVNGVHYDAAGQPGNYGSDGSEHWLSQHNTWQHEEMLISADQFTEMGNGDKVYRLVFHWRNTYYSSNPPAAVDNIELRAITCATPLNVQVSNVGENDATVSWSGNADSYEVMLTSASGTTYQTSVDTFLTLTGLTASSSYQVAVRGFCGSDSSMISQTISFNTACGAISVATTPYSTGFEGTDDEILNCWVSASTGYRNGHTYPHIEPSSVISHTGTHALEVAFGNIVTALPLFVEDISTLQISFWAYNNHWSVQNAVLELGYITDPLDSATFVPLQSMTDQSYTQTTRSFADLAALTLPATTRIAFRYIPVNGSSDLTSWYIDDLVVSMDTIGAGCLVPANLAVNTITQTSAVATWTPGGSETIWNVVYKPVASTNWQTAQVTTPSYTMTGLTPNTDYQVRVQAVCDANETSIWTTDVTFTTLNEDTPTCPAPTNLAVTVDHTDATLTWQQEANTATEWQINYRQSTESDWSTVTATTTTYTLTDLVANVTYEANVVAHCSNGLNSDPSNTVTFETNNNGVQTYLEKSVNLYPNPATEMVSVAVSDANIQISSVEVYNVYGQLINVIESNDNPLRINVSGMADGMYYVRVTTDNGVVTKNFVKR